MIACALNTGLQPIWHATHAAHMACDACSSIDMLISNSKLLSAHFSVVRTVRPDGQCMTDNLIARAAAMYISGGSGAPAPAPGPAESESPTAESTPAEPG